jgi:hypothetical protein
MRAKPNQVDPELTFHLLQPRQFQKLQKLQKLQQRQRLQQSLDV